MQTTMELWRKALTVQHAAAWANEMNLTRAAMTMAKKKGRLSPTVAGHVAMKIGEDPQHWIAVAALEADEKNPLVASLQRVVNAWRKR